MGYGVSNIIVPQTFKLQGEGWNCVLESWYGGNLSFRLRPGVESYKIHFLFAGFTWTRWPLEAISQLIVRASYYFSKKCIAARLRFQFVSPCYIHRGVNNALEKYAVSAPNCVRLFWTRDADIFETSSAEKYHYNGLGVRFTKFSTDRKLDIFAGFAELYLDTDHRVRFRFYNPVWPRLCFDFSSRYEYLPKGDFEATLRVFLLA